MRIENQKRDLNEDNNIINGDSARKFGLRRPFSNQGCYYIEDLVESCTYDGDII